MRLRPYAPLAVVGAGLLIISAASRAASASDAEQPPLSVQVSSDDRALRVDWDAPSASSGLRAYDLRLIDAETHAVLADRTVDLGQTHAVVEPAAFAGHGDVIVTVSADYSGGARAAGDPVRVALTGELRTPPAPPSLQAAGGVLTIRLAKEEDAVAATARTLRILQDGRLWTTVSLPAPVRVWSGTAPAGHEYRAGYRVSSASEGGPFSAMSASVPMAAAVTGPSGVRIAASASDEGLRVRWSSARSGSAEIVAYTIQVEREGDRVGSGYTNPSVRSIVLPDGGGGPITVVVTAKDADGGSSVSSALITPRR